MPAASAIAKPARAGSVAQAVAAPASVIAVAPDNPPSAARSGPEVVIAVASTAMTKAMASTTIDAVGVTDAQPVAATAGRIAIGTTTIPSRGCERSSAAPPMSNAHIVAVTIALVTPTDAPATTGATQAARVTSVVIPPRAHGVGTSARRRRIGVAVAAIATALAASATTAGQPYDHVVDELGPANTSRAVACSDPCHASLSHASGPKIAVNDASAP